MYKVSVNRRLLLERQRIEEDKNAFIKALKSDDAEAAMKALTGMSGDDFGMSHQEFGNLTRIVKGAAKNKGDPNMGGLDVPRKMLGVGKNTPQTTQTHNPVTKQPWTSGPASTVDTKDRHELYNTIVYGDPDDLKRYPHLKTLAPKFKKNDFMMAQATPEEKKDFIEFYYDFQHSPHVNDEDKRWFSDVLDDIWPGEEKENV